MKKCYKCSTHKTLDEFNNNKRSKDGKGNECKACRKIYNHNTYLKVRALIKSAKQKPCKVCNQEYPSYMMDFHHRDPSEKEFTISRPKTAQRSVRRIQKEIDKCDVLCKHCHVKTHHGN